MKPTICVVGNGPSVLGADRGSVVDVHDEVVRVNSFKIQGYEREVGRKTTIWFRAVSKKVAWPTEKGLRCILWTPTRFESIPLRVEEGRERGINVEVLGQAWTRKLIAATEYRGRRIWPSTGLAAIYWALQHGSRVTCLGFDCFQGNDKSHYWEGEPNIKKRRGVHRTHIEQEFISRMSREGKLRWMR